MAKSDDGDSASTKVLVVDDHDLFRTGLAAIVAEEGFVVDAAAGGEAVFERALCFRPDVVLMDVDMPGLSGVEATRRVLEAVPTVRVVMLGYHEECLREAVGAGARGYLGKDSRLDEIVAAIDAVARGEVAFSPRASGALVAHVRGASRDGGVASAALRRLESRPAAAIDLDGFRTRLPRAAA